MITKLKDNNSQTRQSPLTLNPQTELFFANYILHGENENVERDDSKESIKINIVL